MVLSLKGPHRSIQHFIIHGVVGRARMSALVRFSLSCLKTNFCLSPHTNLKSFFTNSLSVEAMLERLIGVLKSLHDWRYEGKGT